MARIEVQELSEWGFWMVGVGGACREDVRVERAAYHDEEIVGAKDIWLTVWSTSKRLN